MSLRAVNHPDQTGRFSSSSPTLDQLDTCFDDPHAIAKRACCARHPGPPAWDRAGRPALIDLGERPGPKMLTLIQEECPSFPDGPGRPRLVWDDPARVGNPYGQLAAGDRLVHRRRGPRCR